MSTENINQPAIDAETTSRWRRINLSDLIITVVLVGVFSGAFVMAMSFSSLAAYFPLGVSALGVLGSLTFLVRVVFFPRKPNAPKAALPDGAQSFSDSEHEFFQSLTKRDWLASTAWLGGFYVVLGLFGIYVACLAFTIAYLRYEVQRKWLFSIAYAIILTGLIWAIFGLVLALPLPTGAIVGWLSL